MNVRAMSNVALLAAVMGLMPPIQVGLMPVPITLQTLGVHCYDPGRMERGTYSIE